MSPLAWIRARLTVRLTLAMLFVSLGPLAAAGAIVLRLIEDSLRRQVEARQAQLAAVASTFVLNYVERARDKLRSISTIVALEPAATPRPPGKVQGRAYLSRLSPEELASRLNVFIQPADVFHSLSYRAVDEALSGEYAQAQSAELTPRQQAFMRNWNERNVLTPAERGSPLVERVLLGREYIAAALERNDENIFLPMAVPIREDGQVFAVLSATLDFQPIEEALRQIATEGRVISLLDAEGRVMVRSASAPLGDSIETERAARHGGWRVVVSEPRAVALAPLNRTRLQAVAWIGGSGTFAFALSLILAARILGPVRRLTAAADAMAAGALGTRSGIDRLDEIGRLAKSFDQMAAALQELDELKSEFVAHVSHELRTPLAAMQLAVANLQDGLAGPLGENHEEVLRRIQSDIERLIRLVNGVLDIARIEAGKFELARGSVDLADVARDAAEALEPLAGKKGSQLSIATAPCVVFGDRERLLQVVTNLLDNAIKFTPAGGRVEVKVGRGILRVSDTGPGIPPERLPRIFDRFARTGAMNAGAGLGLSIAKKIVELHGWTIAVESTVGKGTTFTVTLPCLESSS